ncbi:coiled-coil domain-containing protein 148 [Cynoglossus semilaevis]|uniref:Coiled-coil domain containing 148 n=1 Tax=Cynoglossus semilaevis TaxID=244447 RepID=A0A3P8VPM6_CYNSE|nr:coiled-coil domain-containing protein 148 [Cynoglossus semilaevis]XP_024919493.1 coiled-coil domain-containing protein 148 [Cynoglossus semilaevis]
MKSARDLQSFISKYRADDVEKMALRIKNGLSSSKYKPADYRRLQAVVDAKWLESDLIGQKVERIRCAAKATKESSILQQHRQVWSRECPRLQKAEETADNDVNFFLEHIKPISITDTCIFSLQEYELFLEREREAFRIATVEPVYQLKDDLSYRQGEVQNSTGHQPEWEAVTLQIQFVKDQQADIIASLHAECEELEEEIMGLNLEEYLTPYCLANIESIPGEVLDSDCPYTELKDSLIQAFHYLSEMYQGRLNSLQEQLQRTDRFCGWSPDDHLRYQFTVSQYTHDIPNNRSLCLDMVQRLFPQKTRQDLMEHERVLDWQRFTQAQQSTVTQQWQRDQEELQASALVTLQEARDAHQEELEHQRDRQNQQEICMRLRQKLQQWHEQQQEVAMLEAAIAFRQQAEEKARLKREQEKEAAVRSQQKEKVRQFNLKQEKRREELQQRDEKRLAYLRSVMEEQARKNKERVLFRQDALQQRKEERDEKELERQKQEEDKQNRLEALRNQVAVVVQADPERLMAETEAWRSRRLNEEELELQRPLFSINTYTNTQIESDPRLRVEQALRQAGLQYSLYTKQVLSTIKPPRPPRRDTESSFNF